MMADGSPFYLAIYIENPKPGQKWFKSSPLGVKSDMLSAANMIKDLGLETPPSNKRSSTLLQESTNYVLNVLRYTYAVILMNMT